MVFLGGFLLLLTCFQSLDLAACQQTHPTPLADDLYTSLFTNYHNSLIPICNYSDTVNLTMDLALRQIMELNVKEQVLSLNVWLRMTWNDCRLTWNSSYFNNLTTIMVKYSDIWVPDITLYDSAADEMFPDLGNYRASISSSGSVSYDVPTVVNSVCKVNVRHFPFDTQRCSLKFASWKHNGNELDIVSTNPTGDLSDYVNNNEWLFDNDTFPVERHVSTYNSEPYPDVTFYIVLKRIPDFYVITMLTPCVLITCLAALTFLLPVEAGEKMSVGMTVLLALAVFLLLVSETLPPSSDNFPIIGNFFAISMGLVAMSLGQTAIVLNVFYIGANGQKVPRWLRIVMFKFIGRVVLCGKPVPTTSVYHNDMKSKADMVPLPNDPVPCDPEQPYNVTSARDLSDSNHGTVVERLNGTRKNLSALPFRDPMINVLCEQTEYLKTMAQRVKDKNEADAINGDWRDIARIVDRVFLVIYVIVVASTSSSMIKHAYQQP